MSKFGPASDLEWEEFFKDNISRANLDSDTLSLFHEVSYCEWASNRKYSTYIVEIVKGSFTYRLKFVFDNNTTCHLRIFRFINDLPCTFIRPIFGHDSIPLINLYKYVQDAFPYTLYPFSK